MTDADTTTEEDLLTDIDEPAAPVISALTVTPNEKAPLTCTVSWKTDLPADSAVEFGSESYEFVITDAAPKKEHAIIVAGMRPEMVYQLRAVSEANGLRAAAEAAPFVTPALPEFLADATVKRHEAGKSYDGWTLLTIAAGRVANGVQEVDPDLPSTGVIFDMDGRIVWYLVHALPLVGEAEYYPENGTILFSSMSVTFSEPTLSALVVDLAGNTVWEGPPQPEDILIEGQYHHAFHALPNGNWLTLLEDWRKETNIIGDTIIELNDAHEVLWSWNTFDHLTPDTTGWDPEKVPVFDWTHINSVDYDEPSDTLIANARNTDAVYKIDKKTGDILWTLGRNGDLTYTGDTDTPWFLKAHGAEMLENGNIILFDNGDITEPNVRLWSRAVEYAIGEAGKTAEIVWEYRGEEPFWAPYWGDADRLPNGNTLVSVGTWDEGRRSLLREADGSANTVWELEFGTHNGYTVGFYNACRFDPPVRSLTAAP